MNKRRHRASAMGRGVVDELFSIQVKAIAAVRAAAEAVVTVDGRDQLTRPANGIVSCGNAGPGGNIVPFEINVGIHTLEHGSARDRKSTRPNSSHRTSS